MITRWRLGTFWLMRTVSTKHGTLLIPHATVSWSLFSAIASLEIQGFIQSVRDHSIVGADLRNSMIWRCIAWTPYFFAAWFLTWATATSPVLSRSPNAVKSKYDLTRYPIVVNIFFVVVPILSIVLIWPLSFSANQDTNRVWDLTVSLRQQLVTDSVKFANGDTGNLTNPTLLLEEFHSTCSPIWQDTVRRVQKVWWCWSILAAFLFITYVFAGTYQLRTLRNLISRLQSQNTNRTGNYAERMNSLKWAYRSLCFTAVLTLLIDGIFFAFGLILSIKTEDTLFSRNSLAALVEYGCFWCFCSLGLISTIAILLRSFVPPPSTSTSSISIRDPTSRNQVSIISSHNSTNVDSTISFKSNNSDWDHRSTVGGFKDFGASVKIDQKVEVEYEGDDLELNNFGRSPSAFDLEFSRSLPLKRYD